MKVVLISGLGPGHIENEDLLDSYFDFTKNVRYKYEEIGYKNLLENLYYHTSTSNYKILREKKQSEEVDFISATLKSILNNSSIQYDFIPISKIWNFESIEIKDEAIVCLSTTFMWNENMLEMAVNWIHNNINCKHLIIGGQYSFLKKQYLFDKLFDSFDYLITGEAELSLVSLIKCIQNGNEVNKIPNLYYKNKKFLYTFDQIFNYKETEIVNFEGVHETIPYMSMRGCMYTCKFCALRECTKKWEYYDAKRIVEEWGIYGVKNSTTHFSINDSTFFIPYKRAKEFMNLIRLKEYSWDANSRADTPFKEEDVKLLEESNCTSLAFGFESMCQKTLDSMSKRTTPEQNRYINELFSKSSIETRMSFIVGFPGETIEDFSYTEDYILNEHYGRYSLYVFEYESDVLPISKEKEKYKLVIYNDNEEYSWAHSGQNWSHCGMDSNTAKFLRSELIHKTRTDLKCKAIAKTWQSNYMPNYVLEFDRHKNLEIEKILDVLIFASFDHKEFTNVIEECLKMLEKYNIYYKEQK
ncbi:MAG: radical SAM protein [Peptostreptococcaceae bacterium]